MYELYTRKLRVNAVRSRINKHDGVDVFKTAIMFVVLVLSFAYASSVNAQSREQRVVDELISIRRARVIALAARVRTLSGGWGAWTGWKSCDLPVNMNIDNGYICITDGAKRVYETSDNWHFAYYDNRVTIDAQAWSRVSNKTRSCWVMLQKYNDGTVQMLIEDERISQVMYVLKVTSSGKAD